MAKNIEWKKSSIDYSKLSELTHQKLVAMETGQWLYERNLQTGQMEKVWSSEKRIESVKQSLDQRTFEERSKYSKKGWANDEADKEHISNLGKEYAEVNGQRLREMNQDSQRQSNRGKRGGKKGAKTVWESLYTESVQCPHCQVVGKGPTMQNSHFDKCKQNPNREIIYMYELVKDGISFGKFEEKQDIAKFLECSAALISNYFSGKKKNIKGYQILNLDNSN